MLDGPQLHKNMSLKKTLSNIVKNTNVGISDRRKLSKEYANRQQDMELEFVDHHKNSIR